MAYYWKLRSIEQPAHRKHVAERLIDLKALLRAEITDRTEPNDLRLATWNLMHFGNGGSYWRNTDALLYIAEIIDHFDLVALQEVNDDLSQLQELMENHLGSAWDYIVTDTTVGSLGNRERMAFLFRLGKVEFNKIAGEIVLPGGQSIAATAGAAASSTHIQFARSPFVVAFRAGWFKFRICTVHIYFGESSGPELELRRSEIHSIASFLKERGDKEREREREELRKKNWDTDQSSVNYILLGDFNITSPEHKTMEALQRNEFEIPEGIETLGDVSGLANRHYDQIAFRLFDTRFAHGTCGAIDYRDAVFRDEDAQHYIEVVKPKKIKERIETGETQEETIEYFKTYFRKHQMSDHQLLWASFKIDYSEDYLEQFL